MNTLNNFVQKTKLFAWWLAGVDDNIISTCPKGEQHKYSNLGIFVLFSFIVTTYVFTFLSSITNPGSFFNIFIGLFAGFFIASLERMSMINLRWQGSWKATMILAIPRLLLTLFLGLIVGEALTLSIFSSEITKQLALDKVKTISAITTSASSAYGEIERLQSQNQQLFEQIKEKETERNKLYNSFVGEAEGWSGTMKFGTGPVYHQKKAEFDEISNELQNLRKYNQQQMDDNDKRITMLKNQRDESINQSEASLPKNSGLLLNIEALEKYTNKNFSLLVWRILIILFFIALDSTSVLMKTFSLSPKLDSYESKLEKQRKTITEESVKSYKTDQEINDATEKIRKDKSIVLANSIYEQARIMEDNLAKIQLESWYKDQLKSLSKPQINFNIPPSKN